MLKIKIKSMIQKEFISYILKEIIFLILIMFFLFSLSQMYFKTEISIYLIFVFMCFSILILYIDVKSMYNTIELNKRLENVEFMINNIKKK
jgi:hypothetical protein